MAKVIFNMAKVMVSLNIDSNVDDLTRPGLRPGELRELFDARGGCPGALGHVGRELFCLWGVPFFKLFS